MARRALPPGEWGHIRVGLSTEGSFDARANFRELDGRRVQVVRRGRTAEDATARLLAELSSRAWRPRVLGTGFNADHLFGNLAEEYLELMERGSYASSTKGAIRLLVRSRVLDSELARMRLADIRVSTIAHVYRSMADVPAQARNLLVELRKICDLGVENDVWLVNPARAFKAPRRPTDRPVDVPDVERLAQLHAAVIEYRSRPGRSGPAPSLLLADVLDVILGTSARIGEALGLRWADIVLDDPVPTVSIRGTVIEGSGVPKFYQPFPKTMTGVRRIPCPPFLVETLHRRLSARKPGQTFVFETRSGRPNGPQDVHRALRLVRDWAEIPDGMVPHALRRYVATTVSEAIDLDTAARTLGHRRATITERHYVQRLALAPDARHAIQASVPWAETETTDQLTEQEA